MKNVIELRQERHKVYTEAMAILEKARSENRDLTAEERQEYDRRLADIDVMKGDIDRLERSEALAKEMAAKADRETPQVPETRITIASPEYASAYSAALRFGLEGLDADQRSILDTGRKAENRAQSVITGNLGAYTVPGSFLNRLQDAQKLFGGIRQTATVLATSTGDDLTIPSANDTAVTGELVAENTAATAGDLAFGKVTMKAYKYSSKVVLVPFELLQDTAIDIEAYIAKKLGERIGRITNTHFTTGDGVDKPQGIVTGSTEGIIGASGTTVAYAELIDLTHKIDPAYRANGKWMLHDTTIAALQKLVDGNQRPLWQAGLTVGAPDTLLGYPFIINPDMAEMAANAKSILFGDFSTYYIRDVKDIQLFRITDKYIENGQVGFLCWYRGDGRCVDAGTHPIVHFKNAAA